MMILYRKELKFYITADRIIAGKPIKFSGKDFLKDVLIPNHILRYLRSMRFVAFYSNTKKNKALSIKYIYHNIRFKKLGLKLGFSIGYNSFGYGLLIPHYGTIIVNVGIRAGNYCVLHTSTCIGGSNKTIGNGLYLSSGGLIMGKNIILGDNISIAANSLVNSSFLESNILLAGSPAINKRPSLPWYERDGEIYNIRKKNIEELKTKMGL
jgi:serine O-acetyltransferase